MDNYIALRVSHEDVEGCLVNIYSLFSEVVNADSELQCPIVQAYF